MRMNFNKKERLILLSVILAIVIAISVVIAVLAVRYSPKKLSGIIPTQGIVKIELTDVVYNQETQETKNVTYVLDESKYDDFIKEIRGTKYNNRYQKCKCVCVEDFIIYYESGAEIYFDGLRYCKKENGKTVKYKDIDLETKNFYNLFS